MIRRRLAVALVAAASTSLALVTPVHAEETEPGLSSLSSVSSLSSTTDTDTDTETETDPEAPGTDEDEETTSELPGWAGSLELSPEAELTIEVIRAVMAVGLAATQAAVIIVPLVPGGVDQLRDFLAQFGIQG